MKTRIWVAGSCLLLSAYAFGSNEDSKPSQASCESQTKSVTQEAVKAAKESVDLLIQQMPKHLQGAIDSGIGLDGAKLVILVRLMPEAHGLEFPAEIEGVGIKIQKINSSYLPAH